METNQWQFFSPVNGTSDHKNVIDCYTGRLYWTIYPQASISCPERDELLK